MFGRLGWMEILIIVVLVVILFGHNKIPGMMKNLADGVNVFKRELGAKDDNAAPKAASGKSAKAKAGAKASDVQAAPASRESGSKTSRGARAAGGARSKAGVKASGKSSGRGPRNAA